jgi:hypothetical protein
MIRPPFAERANAVIPRSISSAPRTPTGVNSTPNVGATVWIAASPPEPAGTAGSRITATRITRGAISLSSSSHFPLMLNSKEVKPVALPLGRAKLSTQPPLAEAVEIARAPAVFDAHVAADVPAAFLQPLRERGDPRQRIRIVRASTHEHADPPHALALLRARGKRPSRRSTAEERDEIAPFQRIEWHPFLASQSTWQDT